MYQIVGAAFTLSYAAWLLVEIWVFGIRIGEAALGARFGDAYDEYRRATWAVFPGVW